VAINSQGSKLGHAASGASPTTFNYVEEVTSISGPNGTLNLIDVSHLLSTRKEYLPGLADNGTIDVECNFTAGTEQMLLFDMFNTSADPEEFQIEVPTDSTRTQFHKFRFFGIMSKWSLGDAVDSKVKLSMTIQTTGGVNYLAP
jgi:hypothetical protein